MSENLTLQLTKMIKTKRSRVFAAWTEPAALMQWFAPGPMRPDSIDVDLRVGGIFRWAMSLPSPQGGQVMKVVFSGEFVEIETDRLLQFTWRSEGNPADETLVTVSFADVDGGTEVALRQERILNSEIYQRNKGGWESMLEKLGALCTEAVGANA
ncbi:SRPBCC domain-containing protein [Acidobacteria bacterium AB60]|nr:SRPBCC domain-containing protein [Acidobacteria bacterium AB60]